MLGGVVAAAVTGSPLDIRTGGVVGVVGAEADEAATGVL